MNISIDKNWYDAVSHLEGRQRTEALAAIMDYAFTGVPDESLSPAVRAVMGILMPLIDRRRRMSENGSKGGRPAAGNGKPNESNAEAEVKQTESKSKANGKPIESKQKANEKQTESKTKADGKQIAQKEESAPDGSPCTPSLTPKEEKEKDTLRVSKKKNAEAFSPAPENGKQALTADYAAGGGEQSPTPRSAAPLPARTRFVKPTVEQIRQYCREQGYAMDAERFYDYHESRGWVVGKVAMKDWKAAVRTWHRMEGEFNNTRNEQRFGNTAPQDFTGKGYTDI